jgi:hypothetical protein
MKHTEPKVIIRSIGILLGLLLLFASEALASPSNCAVPRVAVSALGEGPSVSGGFGSLANSADRGATLQLPCLIVTPAVAPPAIPIARPEIFQFSYTLSNLILFEQQAQYHERFRPSPEFILNIGEGVEVLARHLNWKGVLVKALLDSQGRPYPPALVEAVDQPEEFILRVGDVASLAAKVDFMTNLMRYLTDNLMASQIPLARNQDEITLVFNIQGELANVDVATVLQGAASSQPMAAGGLGISQITLKISNGTITSQADFDPADFSITQGQLEVKFRIGSNSLSSTTVFSKGEGVEKEILVITAQLGAFNLTGQATFGSGMPEFKLEASLAGLLSFSTLVTAEGFRQPTFGIELRF